MTLKEDTQMIDVVVRAREFISIDIGGRSDWEHEAITLIEELVAKINSLRMVDSENSIDLDPQEELDKARESLERRFKPYTHISSCAISPTGEEYVNIFVGGCDSPGVAIAGWMSTVDEYARAKSDNAVLYWRCVPEIDQWKEKVPGGWKVYARLLISDKPIVAQAPSAIPDTTGEIMFGPPMSNAIS
jgi:hypothetical protein